ncbi:FAS1-like dehydratase domain-containing protein [Pseudofrankia asymbiotica]|uniref:FAS1-like dehydratase domain-containing protein n=1 Tax=Pseudofrankia asymbiotica TaxID=1834516 RepID=A0A1V2I5Z7_9ACTN|nr:MaoC family dehydratase N-terminal domain-containing protein [Pseudofrankia asymbiotica]ONH26424.1 hypothetical protein BL253_24905 [Pseudofrankia asymbiotica]
MPDPHFGKITDEKIAAVRARIGVDLDEDNFLPVDPEVAAGWRAPQRAFNSEATPDAIRHFVNGYGDDNPLYCDPEYAEKSRWGRLIAPPTFIWSMHLPRPDDDIVLDGDDVPPRRLKPGLAELYRGDPLRGTGALQSDLHYEFFRPIERGDRIFTKRSLVGVEEKMSSWGGRTAHLTWAIVSWNQRGELVHLQRGTWIRAERRPTKDSKDRSGGEAREVQPAPEPYTAEQIEAIEAAYAAETRRGREPRFWEDVEVGEELPSRVKGPLRLTDVILWHAGFGQAFPTYAFRLAYEKRKQEPGLYTPNELNVPDIVQRMHWDAAWARKVGAAERYDYGALRETWLAQLVNDWGGDDSWLAGMRVQHRKFNYVGDTTWLRGRVTGREVVGDQHIARIEVWCENQRGEVTSPGTASVVLPSRTAPVTLPEPAAREPRALLRHQIELLKDPAARRMPSLG